MKKIIYLFMLALGITACNPVDEIYDDLEASEAEINGEISYTLTEDDYGEILELDFPNFNTIDQAKQLIPQVLDVNYPILGESSVAFVTYDRFFRKSTESSLIVYEVTTADYDSYPETARHNNFDDIDQIYTFLDDKFPNASNRTLVSLTYIFYDGSAKELNNGFLKVGSNWEFIQGFTEEQYALAGESFANFSSTDEAEFKIPTLLDKVFEFSPEMPVNTILPVMYNLYQEDVDDVDNDGSVTDRATYSFVINYLYNGSEWVEYSNVLTETLQFGYEGGEWIPDNTINYIFSSEDYSKVETIFIDKYPGPADNVGFFGSFDRRSSSSNYWSDEMLLEAMDAFLDQLNPNAEEEQKYVLTFAVYTGTTVTVSYKLIKSNGDWVLNQ